jgi:hypothetical protein
MRSFDNFEESKSAIRPPLDQADLALTAGQVANAPILNLWQVDLDPFGLTILLGHAKGHPILNGPSSAPRHYSG